MKRSNLSKHLKLVRIHRNYVRKACFKMGLFWQGLVHDLSKYSITELKIAKYYIGKKSPHAECRDQIGYSPSWMHHYHVQKHHWQFWLDLEDWPDKVIPIKMPYKYVIESFCDFVGAGKAYMGNSWTQHAPLDYYDKACRSKRLMNKKSEELLVYLCGMLDLKGEKEFYKWYKENKKEIENNYNK